MVEERLELEFTCALAFGIFPSQLSSRGQGFCQVLPINPLNPSSFSGSLAVSGASHHSKNRYNFVSVHMCQKLHKGPYLIFTPHKEGAMIIPTFQIRKLRDVTCYLQCHIVTQVRELGCKPGLSEDKAQALYSSCKSQLTGNGPQ